MSEPSVKLTVRLPAGLHRALKERAAEYNVSLNQAVVDTLASGLDEEPQVETEKEKILRALGAAGKLSDPATLFPSSEGVEPATLEEIRDWLDGVPLSEWIIEGRGPR